MINNLKYYKDLHKDELLKIKLKKKDEILFGIFDLIGLMQSKAAIPVRPSGPVRFRYSKSVELYLEREYKNMELDGSEIELIEIITVDI